MFKVAVQDVFRFGRLSALTGMLALISLSAEARAGKPVVPPGGFPITSQLDNTVTYSDGYSTFADLTYPSVEVPTGGWPLLVVVHGLGGNRHSVDSPRFATEGYAVWAYDVRGQGDAALMNNPNATTGWAWYGPNEKYDLAEQIASARSQFPSILSQTLVAVAGPSQGGAHAWFAAAHSGGSLTVPGRGTIAFPTIAAALPGLMVADVADTQVRDGVIMSYLMVRTASQPAALVVKDPTTEAQIMQYALADDGPGLAAAWDADPARNWGDLLDTSTVPIAFFHPWHDGIGPPQPAYDRIATLDGPWRAHLSTGGHLTTFNDHEELFYHTSELRWLDHYVWGEANGIDAEAQVALAAMPPDVTLTSDPTYSWGHRNDDSLDPTDAAPWQLYLGNGSLDDAAPSGPGGVLPIQHVVEAGFTPAAWDADPMIQNLAGLLTKMPLSEQVFNSAPLAAETELGGQVRATLSVIPHEPRFQITALLTVQRPGETEDFMLAAWGKEVRDAVPDQPMSIDIKIGGVSTVLPAGTVIRLRLRSLWIVESPMNRDIQGWPSFTSFTVDVEHSSPTAPSLIELPRRTHVRPTLNPPITTFSLANPSTIQLALRGGASRGGHTYVVFMGVSGHAPGVPVAGGLLPLKFDVLTNLVASFLGYPLFSSFTGTLDVDGNAQVTVPLSMASLPQSLIGGRATLAGWIMGPNPGVTNPTDVFFQP